MVEGNPKYVLKDLGDHIPRSETENKRYRNEQYIYVSNRE